jgi:hypothetical protein
MYALIYKNKVISGPKSWSKGFWLTLLKQRGITNAVIPRNPVENLPYKINDDTKICQVQMIQSPIDNMVQYHRGPLWDLSGDIAVANYEVIDTPIEFARGNFKELAKQERRKKENTSINITVQNTEVKVATDAKERSVFTAKLASIGESDTVNWKFNETWLQLSRQDLQQIVSDIDAHVQSTFDWEKDIDSQIDAAASAEELLAIEIVEPRENQRPNFNEE